MECKTVAVESKDSDSGYMIINEEDYDPKVHTLIEIPEAPAPAEPAPAAEGEVPGPAPEGDGLEDLKVSDLRASVKATGIKLADIKGSGEGGNVIKNDLVSALRAHAEAPVE